MLLAWGSFPWPQTNIDHGARNDWQSSSECDRIESQSAGLAGSLLTFIEKSASMYVLETIQLEESPGVVVKLEVLVEDSMVQGNVGPGECELEDKQLESDVLAEWDGNNYCWCILHVVAQLAGSPEIYGDDFLGQTSILEKYLAPGETLEKQALQMVEDHDMISCAKGELQRAIVGVEMSIADFRAES